MLSSDISCFIETWGYPCQHFETLGFAVIKELRIDSTGHYKIIYAKHSVASFIELKIIKKIYSDRRVLAVVLFNYY